jgi:diacylglycerol kinase
MRRFKYAFRGVLLALGERSVKVHLALGALTVAVGAALGISRGEWVAVIICIAIVIALETVNSAIERLGDAVTRERRADIAAVKDMAAGAVLIASVGALAVGLVIFLPKLLAFL